MGPQASKEEPGAPGMEGLLVHTACKTFVDLDTGEAVKAVEATESPEGGHMNIFKGPQRETSQSGTEIQAKL